MIINKPRRRKETWNRLRRQRSLRQSPVPKYTRRHSGTLMVVGGSRDALTELREARSMRQVSMIAVVGHAAGFVKADFVVSDHYEIHEELRLLQDKFGKDHYTTHCTLTSHHSGYPSVDYWWNWRRAEASSVQTAIRIGLAVGFTEVILCGCPLEHGTIQHPLQREKDGYEWPPARDVIRFGHSRGENTSEEILASFKRYFVKFAPFWRGRVFSMSGFTQNILGSPPVTMLKCTSDVMLTESPLRARVIKQWSGSKGSNNVYPKRYGKWPDEDSVRKLQELCLGRVCDVGCGTGRCAEAFSPDRYVGIDINEDAIRVARREYPRYTFETVGWDDPYPVVDTYLFYTVLLHIPDDELIGIFNKTCNGNIHSRLVVFECMNRENRNEDRGNFQRDSQQYADVAAHVGRIVTNLVTLSSVVEPFFRHFMVIE